MAQLNPAEVDFAEVARRLYHLRDHRLRGPGLLPAGQGLAGGAGRAHPGGRGPAHQPLGRAQGPGASGGGLGPGPGGGGLLAAHRPGGSGARPAQAAQGGPSPSPSAGWATTTWLPSWCRPAGPSTPPGFGSPATPPASAPWRLPRPSPPPERATGRLLSATVLHSPPEGFPAPLNLGLARTGDGWMTLVHPEEGEPPVLGAHVRLRLTEGLYTARPTAGSPGHPAPSGPGPGPNIKQKGILTTAA